MSLNNRLASSFTRLPPDGAGKRLDAFLYHEVQYNAGTHTFIKGDYIKGVTSGEVCEIVEHYPTGAGTGYVWAIVEDLGTGNGFTAGEQIQLGEFGGPVVATCVSSTPRLVSNVVNVGKNNPAYGQYIDNQGAANVRFAEGSPLFAPFGNMKVANSRVVAVYEHSTDSYDDLFTSDITGAASITWNSTSSEVVLTVDNLNGTACHRTTDRYHYYLPGTGQTIMQTVCLGDTGKVNNVRRWGYYDDADGVFFELSGTDMNVVLRSTVSGARVDTRVSQSDWSDDKLNGNGLSGVTFRPDRYWVYFIDLQWLGAGRVRMGVSAPNGTRVVCHEFQNSGEHSYLYMARASLPLRYTNFNNGPTSGPSFLKDGCSTVRHEGDPDYTFWRYSDLSTGLVAIPSASSTFPILGFRSLVDFNGEPNRVTSYPETLAVYVSGTGPVKITLGEASLTCLTGATWSLASQGPVEGDLAATGMSTSTADWWPEMSWYVNPGQAINIDLDPYFEVNDTGIQRTRGGDQPPWIVTAQRLDPATTASVSVDLTYRSLF